MTLLCRPRAGGDPYAAARRCGRAGDNAKPWWLWVPACAGTTASRFVPRTLEHAGVVRSAFAGTNGLALVKPRGLVEIELPHVGTILFHLHAIELARQGSPAQCR